MKSNQMVGLTHFFFFWFLLTKMSTQLIALALLGSLSNALVSAFSAGPCTAALCQSNLATSGVLIRHHGRASMPASRSLRMSRSSSAESEELGNYQHDQILRRGFLSVVAAGVFSAKANAAEDKGGSKKGGQSTTSTSSSSTSSEQGASALGCETPKPKPGQPEVCETDY